MQQEKKRGASRATATVAAGTFVALLVFAAGAGFVANASTSYNVVQVFVSTSSQIQYQYYYSVYNLTGSLVGSYQSSYPAAAFELPAGGYLFTVSAVSENQYVCNMCMQPVPAVGYANGTSTTEPSVNRSGLTPVAYKLPSSEYGFQVEQVTGPDSFTISTKNVTDYPVNQVTVKVSYANGTAAAGASVSGSVVGQWYYWWGGDSKAVMWAQTDGDGVATLVLPSAPVVVSAWSWVPVNLPADQKTVTVIVGGEPVNVTVYWQPMYVGLAASALIIPPANSVSLTLHYEQPAYWVTGQGGAIAMGSDGASVSNQPTAVPSQSFRGSQSGYYSPAAIPAFGQSSNTGGTQASSGTSVVVMEAVGIAAAAAAAVGLAILSLRRPRTSS